jgi:hypothetical protein
MYSVYHGVKAWEYGTDLAKSDRRLPSWAGRQRAEGASCGVALEYPAV